MLDGGGARLADAATRHHLTQTTNKKRKEENSGEQNKHKRTQTIQKTSTSPSTSDGHHTLPSMRSKTPIQQQRTTQTQQRRSRPHNPSITRRNQSPRQRTSPLRQMQQQTRQRTRRQRQSTPLPEKRGRTRQTTRSRHANTMLRHMVNPHRHSTITGKAGREEMRGAERREHNKEDTMVFGDNVRARKAARALPRTPTAREEERKRERRRRQATRPHTPPFPTNANHHRHPTMTHPCHKHTTLNQQCCDREHKRGEGEGRQERQYKKGKNNMKGRTQSEHETTHKPRTPPFNKATG